MYKTIERQRRDLLIRLIERESSHLLSGLAFLDADGSDQPASKTKKKKNDYDITTHSRSILRLIDYSQS